MFGGRLRTLRKQKKMTMKELGSKFSLAESTISGYENGNRKPDLEVINAFADFFQVSTDYLLGRTDDPSPTIKDRLNNLPLEEGDHIQFFNMDGLTEEDIEFIESQINHLKKRAKKFNNDTN